VQANWKLIVQNYSECYHCPLVHPALADLSDYTSGQNDLVDGPFLGGFMDINHEGGSLTMSGQACALPIDGLPVEDLDRVYYYAFFPNMLLSMHPDYVLIHHLWPQGPGRTRIVCRWLFHPTAIAHPDFNPDDAVEFWDMTNQQDWHVCELSQLGVASRAYTTSPYSNRESLLVAFDREVLKALAQGE
jgi:Rieske 2Fe-2S family protein